MNALAIENLCVYHGTICLVGPLSFGLEAGKSLVIMGETGAGKSLILQAILGILPKGLRAEGRVCLGESAFDPAHNKSDRDLWGRAISILPQEAWQALDPLMKSWKQVFHTHTQVAQLTSREALAKTSLGLQSLGLEEQESRLVSQVSGGMAQRLAFLAARAGGAKIFLADEPTKGLDYQRQAQITSLLGQVKNIGGCLVCVTHDAGVARKLGGNLMVLKDGKLVEQGSCQAVFSFPQNAYTKELLEANPQSWQKTNPRTNNQKLMLKASKLAIKRGGKILFEDFSINLHQGEKIAICGPSGVGKTSLLNCLSGLLQPLSGTIRVFTKAKYPIQKLYQDPQSAFPSFVRVKTILEDTAKLHKSSWEEVLDYFAELQLSPSLMDRLPDSLSGGELQRISIVRALLAKPAILLADEPTNRLDPITQKQTLEFINSIQHKNQISTLLVTHNIPLAEKWADSCIHIKAKNEGTFSS